FAQGDALTVGAQVASAVTTTGRYPWSLRLQGSGGAFDITVSGTAFVVAQDASALGAGWTLSNVNKLVNIAADANGPAGQLWVYGTGGYRFFTGTSGTLTSPAEDNGTLVKNGGGDFTYTAIDGSKINFNSSGYETSAVSADGKELITFTYDGSNRVSTETSIDGGVATFTYANNGNTLLSKIAAPGARTYTFTTSGTDLTQIQDPDSNTHTFAYTSHRITSETRGSVIANQFHYSSAGLLDQFTQGSATSPSVSTVSPVWARGLSAPVLGAPVATVTDAV